MDSPLPLDVLGANFVYIGYSALAKTRPRGVKLDAWERHLWAFWGAYVLTARETRKRHGLPEIFPAWY